MSTAISNQTATDPIKAALFPVELRDVYVPMPTAHQMQSHFHAVVDVERSNVFAIVTETYALITNEDAIALGRQCFSQILQLTDINQMRGFQAIMPKTRSFCHLDFLHDKKRFAPLGNSDDVWQPYLRITNSYNKTYALNFDLGFCRSICKNGMIFGKKNIEFKFAHSRRGKDPEAEFTLHAGEFAALELQFTATLVNLEKYHVPKKLMWPLFCKAFEFKIPTNEKLAKEDPESSFIQRRTVVQDLTKKYFDDLGENGYAAINVLTDYASRPVAEKVPEMRINHFQRACGDWMSDFVAQIENRDFNFRDYLGEYHALAN